MQAVVAWRPRSRRHLMVGLAAALMSSACGKSLVSPETSHDLDVKYGATVVVPGDTTTIRFLDVPEDSRCPANVQCLWAGEAVTQFVLGGNQLITLTLGVNPASASITTRTVRITLTALKPAPSVAGEELDKSKYVASLRFTN